jgi:uncharacterized OsmC-like protein
MINGIDTQALAETVEAVKARPGLADVTFSVASEWRTGCVQHASTSDLVQDGAVVSPKATHVMESDEPMALLGTDSAASPGEYILQALAGCYAVTCAANAATRGIELSHLRLELQSDFNLHGFLGLDKSVRPGAQEIRVVVHAESPNASREQLQELVELVKQRSPIGDTLASAVSVRTTLADAAPAGQDA